MTASVFDPLLCFARNPRQTPEEVFDMLQERMITLLGIKYAEKGADLYCMSDDQVDKAKMLAISDWQTSTLCLDTGDFDRLGTKVGLSITDVLGRPRMTQFQKEAISKAVGQHDDISLDPTIAFVTLAVFDRIDDMVREQRAMTETQIEDMKQFGKAG